jgi:hypothetical protein
MVSSSVQDEKVTGPQDSAIPPITAVPPGTNIPDSELGSSTVSLDNDVALAIVGEHSQEIDKAARVLNSFLIPVMVVGTIMFNTILYK